MSNSNSYFTKTYNYNNYPTSIEVCRNLPFKLGEQRIIEWIRETMANSPCTLKINLYASSAFETKKTFHESYVESFDNPQTALDMMVLESYRMYRQFDRHVIGKVKNKGIKNVLRTGFNGILDERAILEIEVDEIYKTNGRGFIVYEEVYSVEHLYQLFLCARKYFAEALFQNTYRGQSKDLAKVLKNKHLSKYNNVINVHKINNNGYAVFTFKDAVSSFLKGINYETPDEKRKRLNEQASKIMRNLQVDEDVIKSSLYNANSRKIKDSSVEVTLESKQNPNAERFDRVIEELQNLSSSESVETIFKTSEDGVKNSDEKSKSAQKKLDEARKRGYLSYKTPMFNSPSKKKKNIDDANYEVSLHDFETYKKSSYVGADLEQAYKETQTLMVNRIYGF